MGKTHRNHAPQFKAKVALEALAGEKTIHEIVAKYQVHPTSVTQRRRHLIDQASLFGKTSSATDPVGDREALLAKIGRLTVATRHWPGELMRPWCANRLPSTAPGNIARSGFRSCRSPQHGNLSRALARNSTSAASRMSHLRKSLIKACNQNTQCHHQSRFDHSQETGIMHDRKTRESTRITFLERIPQSSEILQERICVPIQKNGNCPGQSIRLFRHPSSSHDADV